MKAISLDECFKNSFTNFTNKRESDITILDEQFKDGKGVTDFSIVPAMYIEDYLVRGAMKPMSLASSICDSLLNPPKKICSRLESFKLQENIEGERERDQIIEEVVDENPLNFGAVVSIILVLVFGVMLIFLCAGLAKRLMDKNIQRQIEDDVDHSVHEYIRMRDPNSSMTATNTSIEM